MKKETETVNIATEGSIVRAFFSYSIPSLVAILCITTASVVDGLFVGRYVGGNALASLALLIPYFTLVFGLTLMFSVGGSVQVSYYLGEKNKGAASAIFSKIVLSVVVLAVGVVLFSLLGQGLLFPALNAESEMLSLMSSYMGVMGYALGVQMLGMVCYYFMRVAGKPQLATVALVIGSVSNVLLDWLFVGGWGLGVSGAAWATLVAQSIQLSLLAYFFCVKQDRLSWVMVSGGWNEVWVCAKNGFSEFVNEISVGVVIYLINYLMVARYGVVGLAAFSVVNYIIFVSVMVTFGVVDGVPPLVGENMGAGKYGRVRGVMRLAFICLLIINGIAMTLVLFAGKSLAGVFLGSESVKEVALVGEILSSIWPLFLIHGLNILIALYLTGLRKPMHSAVLAMSRSLILPIIFVSAVFWLFPDQPFLVGLPAAEALTFVAAVYFYFQYRPEQIEKKQHELS